MKFDGVSISGGAKGSAGSFIHVEVATFDAEVNAGVRFIGAKLDGVDAVSFDIGGATSFECGGGGKSTR